MAAITRVALAGMALVMVSAGCGQSEDSPDETGAGRSTDTTTATTSSAANPVATVRVEPSTAAAGERIVLTVAPEEGAEITWGELVTMRSSAPTGGAGASQGTFALIGVRPGSGGEPRSCRPGEECGVNDIGYTGRGQLELVVPPTAVSGPYVLSLDVRSGTARQTAQTTLNVV